MSNRAAIRLSDHALVMFMARAGGFEVEALRGAIEASLNRAMTAAARIDARDLTIRVDGLRYVVSNGVVVTIEHARKPGRRARR